MQHPEGYRSHLRHALPLLIIRNSSQKLNTLNCFTLTRAGFPYQRHSRRILCLLSKCRVQAIVSASTTHHIPDKSPLSSKLSLGPLFCPIAHPHASQIVDTCLLASPFPRISALQDVFTSTKTSRLSLYSFELTALCANPLRCRASAVWYYWPYASQPMPPPNRHLSLLWLRLRIRPPMYGLRHLPVQQGALHQQEGFKVVSIWMAMELTGKSRVPTTGPGKSSMITLQDTTRK